MTYGEIEKESLTFFEFPAENRDVVTTISAILFAQYILKKGQKSYD